MLLNFSVGTPCQCGAVCQVAGAMDFGVGRIRRLLAYLRYKHKVQKVEVRWLRARDLDTRFRALASPKLRHHSAVARPNRRCRYGVTGCVWVFH